MRQERGGEERRGWVRRGKERRRSKVMRGTEGRSEAGEERGGEAGIGWERFGSGGADQPWSRVGGVAGQPTSGGVGVARALMSLRC